MKTLLAVAGIAAAVLAAGSASAQPRQGGQGGFQLGAGSSITLYDLPNFQGQARTFNNSVDNLADLGLNDRAQSAKVQGRWRVCTDSGLRGRCVDLTGDVPNLATLGVTAAISSFQDQNRGQGGFSGDRGDRGDRGFERGPGPGFGDRDDRGFDRNDRSFAGQALEGRTATFYPRPTPGPYRNADEFCRRLGFAGVIYADQSRGFEIRDVLCRR